MQGLVVNYATSGYLRGQERLRSSCESIGQAIACYGPRDNFTPHADWPYYFKIDSFRRASERHHLLLWVDASIVTTGQSLEPIFDYLASEGCLLTWQGWNNAQWCNDGSLASFGFTRDEAERQWQVRGGFLGLNLQHPAGKLLLEETARHRDDFRGRWENRDKTESQDPRCMGHRHDQSVFSLVAARHHLKILRYDEHKWCCYDPNPQYLLNILGNPL
jgi:hypothetical protein